MFVYPFLYSHVLYVNFYSFLFVKDKSLLNSVSGDYMVKVQKHSFTFCSKLFIDLKEDPSSLAIKPASLKV